MIRFSDVLQAIRRADRLRTAVAIVSAATLLELYVAQLQRNEREVVGLRN